MSDIESNFEDPFATPQEEAIKEVIEEVLPEDEVVEDTKYGIFVDNELLGYVDTQDIAKKYIQKIAKKLKGNAYLRENYRGIIIDDCEYEDYLELLGYHWLMPVRIYKTLYRIYYMPIKHITVPVKDD